MIISRQEELQTLRDALQSEYSSFIAVYGRRRVGKTFLIREAYNYNFTFQHAGLYKQPLKVQMAAFMDSLRDAGFKGVRQPSNWIDAFALLKELIQKSKARKKIIFIDELSWMDVRNGKLIPALESFWNKWASARKDIVLIVCASATGWVMNKVIRSKGGLYNRLSATIPLHPFSLSECEQYTKAYHIPFTRDQIAEYYMIAGGVPFYWSKLEKNLSLAQNVDKIYFAPDAPLREEYKYLFAALFEAPEPYMKAIAALATQKGGMTRNELLKAGGLPTGGKTSEVLENLIDSDFIRKYAAYGKKCKQAKYQLIDNFVLFHFSFLQDTKRADHYWQTNLNTPRLNTWRGIAFERLCLLHTAAIKKTLGISGVSSQEYSLTAQEDPFRGINKMQIDLIIDRADKTVNLCEMKYYQKPYSISKKDEEQLRGRIADFQALTQTNKAIQLTFITAHGLLHNSQSGIVQSELTLNDLFLE